jgi:hypothetical protein
LLFDIENGRRIISERMQVLEVSDWDIDEYLHYYDFPSLDLSRDATSEYVSLLDKLKPDLAIYDSWVGFLAACGLEDNSSTNVEEWANAYVHPTKSRDCTVVILDHVPHDANRSRGATRKKDLVDIQWSLKKVKAFDRSNVGFIQLSREKDREGWLPERVGFSIGGSEEGFVFRRSEGTMADTTDELPESAREAERALKSFDTAGATYTEWRKATVWKDGKPMGDSTFRTARSKLMEPSHKRVRQDGDRYYSNNSNQAAIAVDTVDDGN